MTQVPSSKPEHSRAPRDERESTPASVLPWEQGRLFSQLFIGESDGFSRSLNASTALSERVLVEAFTEQLVARLYSASQWPLHAAFFLPRLGRVDVNVRREQGGWHVDLNAEDECTRVWLGNARQRWQDRLSADLGQPVYLSLAPSGCPR